jgi:hypothetical protein
LSALLVALGLVLAADAGVAAPAPTSADAPTVSARADKSEVHVGDVIQLTVVSVGPRETSVNLPRSLELGPFAELDEQNRKIDEKDLGDGKMRREFTVFVAAYEPGELTLPSLEVTYLGKRGELLTTRTEAIPIKIVSLIANEPEPGLKDNAPPVRVLERDLLLVYIAAGLAAAGLGALAAILIRRRLRARASQRPAPPPRPAHDIALEKLDRLGAAGFADDGDHRPFYFLLSEVIREYLGARFGFDSLELTTAELMDELRRHAGRGLVMGEIEGWLSGCDLVKFAKFSPSATEARGALEMAIRIVESTRPRPEPQVGPGSPLPPTAPAPPAARKEKEAAHA